MASFFLCECLCLLRLNYYSKRSRFKVEAEPFNGSKVQPFNVRGQIEMLASAASMTTPEGFRLSGNLSWITCSSYSVVER
jgi:hypothetical protein